MHRPQCPNDRLGVLISQEKHGGLLWPNVALAYVGKIADDRGRYQTTERSGVSFGRTSANRLGERCTLPMSMNDEA
jgi:hypothetical protein